MDMRSLSLGGQCDTQYIASGVDRQGGGSDQFRSTPARDGDLTAARPLRAPYCMPVPRKMVAPRRQLLRDDALAAMRAAIVDGTLEPEERLVDAELSAWLGVSRTPI